MLQLAWRTFRDRSQVFAGAIVTVCLGVALVQSSLLALISAATPTVPPEFTEVEATALREAHYGALVLLGMQLALVTFVTVFIVSSTFSFAVAQRRQELALLRMTGADRGQLRSLLVGEAVLLGAVGSTAGIVLGVPVLRLQVWMLEQFDFVPSGFEAQWRWWIVPASLATGVLIAVIGVLAASRRASTVRPLEALRESGQAARVMTVSRWMLGVLFTGGGVFLLMFFPAGNAALAPWFLQITPFLVSVPLAIGFSALAPLIVPLVGGLFGLFVRGPLGELTLSNLRVDARRSAATAAPVMLLIAFVASIAGTLDSISEAAREETLRTVHADLVVTTDRPAGAEMTGMHGVELVSEETTTLVEIRDGNEYGDVWYEAYEGRAVDPATYLETRDVNVTDGDLADLVGSTLAVSPNAWERTWQVGDVLHLRLDGEEHEAQVVALLPGTVAGPELLLSPEMLGANAGQWQHIVQLADGADDSEVVGRLAGLGTVESFDQWVGDAAAAEERITLNIMIMLLGTTMLYTVIAMINAVVIAASERRREFAAARVTGLSRAEVVRVAFWESQVVVLIGLLLGGIAAAASVWGVSAAIHTLIGITVVSIPWPLLAALALGSALIIGVTNIITTLSATRTPPIRLVASRE